MCKSEEEWVYCPFCKSKTRVKLRQDTVLAHFPLFCPKCKRESLINAENFRIEKIEVRDAKTQCRF